MSSDHVFACYLCKEEFLPSPSILKCTVCDSPLDVKYIQPNTATTDKGILRIPLPLKNPSDKFSLGEGNTPTINLINLSNWLGINLLTKNEAQNPTGSFKDRGTSILISCLRSFGIEEIVEDSSGNAGSSISAYSAAAGIKAHIFAPESAPQPKINQIKGYGAVHHSVQVSRDKVRAVAKKYALDNNLTYASHNLSPYFIEGTKSFGYELLSDRKSTFPSDIVIPVGNGSLYLGIYKAMNELLKSNHIERMPRMHFVQSESVKPIAAAARNELWHGNMVTATKAGGIAVGSPPRIAQVINAMKASDGQCDTVQENEIIDWQLKLAQWEGIYSEPTSAAAFAGTFKLIESKKIAKGSTVLVPVTGSGLKDLSPI